MTTPTPDLRRLSEAAERGDVEASADFGLLLAKAGKFKEAEPLLRKAAEAGITEARHNLGVLLRELGRPSEAVDAFRAAGAEGNAASEMAAAELLLDMSRESEAEEAYRSALTLGSREAAVHLTALLRERGDTDGARNTLNCALEARVPGASAEAGRLAYANGEVGLASRRFVAALRDGDVEAGPDLVELFDELLISRTCPARLEAQLIGLAERASG